MKKVLAILVTMAMLILCVGCGATKESVESLTPDPAKVFPNSDVELIIKKDDRYAFTIHGMTSEDLDTYISAVKENGVTNQSIELDNDYGAYSEDGKYYLECYFLPDKGDIEVYCKVSKNYHEKSSESSTESK